MTENYCCLQHLIKWNNSYVTFQVMLYQKFNLSPKVEDRMRKHEYWIETRIIEFVYYRLFIFFFQPPYSKFGLKNSQKISRIYLQHLSFFVTGCQIFKCHSKIRNQVSFTNIFYFTKNFKGRTFWNFLNINKYCISNFDYNKWHWGNYDTHNIIIMISHLP